MSLIDKLKEYWFKRIGWECLDFGTEEEWDAWAIKMHASHPFTYFMVEKLPEIYYEVYRRTIGRMSTAYFKLRTKLVIKPHVIKTSFKYDYDGSCLLLYANFAILNQYMGLCAASIYEMPWYKRMWYKYGPEYRNEETGVMLHRNILEIDSVTHYSDSTVSGYLDLLELYTWWNVIRPNRITAYELSGMSKFEQTAGFTFFAPCSIGFTFQSNRSQPEFLLAMDEHRRIIKLYDDEDTEMLIKLIKIRKDIGI